MLCVRFGEICVSVDKRFIRAESGVWEGTFHDEMIGWLVVRGVGVVVLVLGDDFGSQKCVLVR